MTKKYYPIGEVSEMLSISQHSLRYMDNILKLKVTRIRGRRYYKQDEIELLKANLNRPTTTLDKLILDLIEAKTRLLALL